MLGVVQMPMLWTRLIAAARPLAGQRPFANTMRRFANRNFSTGPSSGGGGTGGSEGESAGPKVSWKTFAPLGLLFGGAGAYWNISRYQKQRDQRGDADQGDAMVKVQESIGKAQLGGPWRLMNTDAKYVTDKDFNGSWLYMYFGFTYCPDICPNELVRMKAVIEALDKNPATKDKIKPVFVTIDPARDGPAQLKAYLEDWHPKMLGLTGTLEEVESVCKAFRVYKNKAQLGPDPNDYLIDHSVLFYLVDPKGGFVKYFAPSNTPEDMTETITKEITAWKE